MSLLAVRLIDLAIFGTLGGLWIGGALFIVVLYRWILRFEASSEPNDLQGVPVEKAPTLDDEPARPAAVIPQTAVPPGALPSHT
jgi:hypothetical protein